MTLAEPTPLGLGSLTGGSVALTAFQAGVATGTPTYTFTNKTTAPQALVLRATDTDAVSSVGFVQPSVALALEQSSLR